MNREILFRGKRVDNEAWETGSLVVQWPYTSREKVFITDKNTAYHTPVDPDTVGQYTGLTDKNGKRIFEGDIVEYVGVGWDNSEMTRADVVWCGYDGCWGTTEGEDYCPDALTAPYAESMTVVGNIHDNPELMEV